MSTNDAEKQALQLLEEMFANIPDVLGVRLWNGKLWPDEQPRAATLVLQHPNALAGILSVGTEAGLAAGYLRNDFDLEGDIEAAFECVDVLPDRLKDWRKKWKMAALLWRLPRKSQRHIPERLLPKLRGRRHSPERDRRAVTFRWRRVVHPPRRQHSDPFCLQGDSWRRNAVARFGSARFPHPFSQRELSAG